MPLNAGDLNARVSLELDDIVRVKGVEKKVPRIYATSVPAKVEPLSGREFWDAQQINSQVNWKVTLRYRTDVESEHRVIYRDRKLEIVSIQPDEARKDSVTLMCREMNQ